ncbi:MAG: ParB/RepB/Spo0J family partition protein [Desulfovibrionaceae bacterium]|nr:ParB/RepB/Spo0J family partition protein [Desulfovibrionaceae bacterium]
MSSSKLGRGLTALLDENQEQEVSQNTEVSVDLLKPNPWQPRTEFNQEHLEELAASIRNQGIIQPLLVREMPDGTYQVIAGERRLRAAKLINLATVPVFIRKMTDSDVMESTLIENLQREDLNPIEEALAMKKMCDELSVTQEDLATKLGRSRSSIANTMRLLKLSPEVQDDVRAGRMSAGHARALLAISDGEVVELVRKHVVQNRLSVRETEDLIAEWKRHGRLPWDNAPADGESEVEVKEAPAQKKKAQQSEIALKMQEVIAQVLQCKAKVAGTEDKGKITITYSSPEELQQILMKIGASTLDDGKAQEKEEEQKAEDNGAEEAAHDG